MRKCYQDELIESIKVKDSMVCVNKINRQYNNGKFLRNIHAYMPFGTSRSLGGSFVFNVLLRLMPIYVVKVKEEYACVGNVRSLYFARKELRSNKKIPVKVVSTNLDVVRQMILVDLIVLPMLFSPGKNRKLFFDRLDVLSRDVGNFRVTKGCGIDAKIRYKDNFDMREDVPLYKNNINNYLTYDCVVLLVMMFPVYVGEGKSAGFIGNKFILKLSRDLFKDEIKVPYRKVTNIEIVDVNAINELMVVLPICIFGLDVNGYKYIKFAFDKTSIEDKFWVFNRKITYKDLSCFISCSNKSLRYAESKLIKHNVAGKQVEDLEKHNIKSGGENE
ncbi:MAG: hypothetical protein QM484_07230 [Woeseiaceae bacterium]